MRGAVRPTVAVAAMLCALLGIFARPVIGMAQALDGRWERPMGLGVEAPVERSYRVSGAPTKPIDKCRQWRRIANRLGETYAGVRLRQSIVERVCAFADQDVDAVVSIWSWPWAQGGFEGELPPRIRGRFGGWTIRCGAEGVRERCAIVHEALANAGLAAAGSERIRVITHFVINDIGGQERVLWRVFVERADDRWFAGTDSPTDRLANVVRYRLGSSALSEPLAGCGTSGCLMEADIRAGSRAASSLWDGRALDLDVRPTPGVVLAWQVPASGFKLGLRELVRLRQSEARQFAGR